MEIIDSNGYVSEFTKNTLTQFGWVPGDPIPGNLGELIQQIDERTTGTKKPGLLLDISLLTETDTQLVKDNLEEAKVALVKIQARIEKEKKTAHLHPDAAAFQQKLEAMNEAAVQIVDDRDAPVKEDKTATPAAVETEDKPTQSTSLPDDGTIPSFNPDNLASVFCPRCNWDTRQKYEVVATDHDKELFLISILGDSRFEKEFTLFNEQYAITFKNLLAEENKIIHRQLTIDQKNGEFNSDTEWFLRFFEYRLACSVRRIIVKGKPTAEIPDLDEIKNALLPLKADELDRPPLLRLYDYVIKDLLKNEITRRLVSKHFREFQRLYEALEAMALEPSFW